MGLFNWGGSKPEIKDEKEAFLAIIYAAIAADGVVEVQHRGGVPPAAVDQHEHVVGAESAQAGRAGVGRRGAGRGAWEVEGRRDELQHLRQVVEPARGQFQADERSAEELVELGSQAGYDLSGAFPR